jgi:hypothetical protein
MMIVCVSLFVASLMQTDPSWAGPTAIYAEIFIPIAIFIDRYRRFVKVTFDPEGVVAKISEALSLAFFELMKSEKTWYRF